MSIKGTREIYKEIIMKQKKGVMEIFNKFFLKEQFNTIIELGTSPGGFAAYVANKAIEMSASFTTFDIRDPAPGIEDYLKSLNFMFFKEDLDESTKVEELIHNGGRVLILNDALKEKHLLRFSPLLKLGDCIISHDYGTEYVLEDVSENLQKYGLEVRYSELFTPEFLWLCCIKEV